MNTGSLIGLALLLLAGTVYSACTDQGTNCAQFSGMCYNQVYASILQQYCKNTCDNCPGTCKDNSPRCPSWKRNGFCQSSYYTQAHKAQYCSKSCGICQSNGGGDGGSGNG
ncbi:unnamed protein product [Bursaphelenchus xylophilus]|uniref:(pine wood nematode) hypothetical protein n=1 Tax=Bursaphelenchus xylophilus TaxID=6326 RepID=A0A1I7S2R3_BURXY|nr:unnamed protein product [Bursaphelenchus xylophilus]CAG9121701.1 unnamed protein product [Bursaphelenchus xylophilus]